MESVAALVTPIVPGSGVTGALLLVSVQRRPPREGGRAVGAGERPLARVLPQVVPQGRLRQESLADFAPVPRLLPDRPGCRPEVQGLVEHQLGARIRAEHAPETTVLFLGFRQTLSLTPDLCVSRGVLR